MKTKTIVTFNVLALFVAGLLSSPAYAKKGKHHYWDNNYRYHQQATTFKKARVIDVQPIFKKNKKRNRHQQQCWLEPVYQGSNYYGNKRRNNKTADIIAGSIIGGAIGNQFGSGNGRKAATVAGAAIGASIASDYSDNRVRGQRHQRMVEVCENGYPNQRYGNAGRGQVKGYNVTYKFKGEIYQTFTRHHPGNYIRLQINIIPQE